FLIIFLITRWPLEHSEAIDIPVVNISVDTEENAGMVFDALKDLSRVPPLCDLSFCVTLGAMIPSCLSFFRFPSVRGYHRGAKIGMSIGYKSSVGTSGAIFKSKVDGSFYGLTVAHLFGGDKDSAVGRRVMQPARKDFMVELENVRKSERDLNAYLKSNKSDEDCELERKGKQLKSVVEYLSVIEKSLQNESETSLDMGTVKHSKYHITTYQNRK